MRRLLQIVVVATLLLAPFSSPASTAAAQSGSAGGLLAQMTPAEKVGQLFLVTFYGPTADTDSDIQQLITQYHIGGVALVAANDNFTNTLAAPAQVLSLTNQLQNAASAAALIPRDVPDSQSSEARTPPFIPLFIAINADDYSQALTGLSEMPNLMALGATWDAAQAETMGRLTGQELSALGVNMLLGPALDVVDNPRPQSSGDLGAGIFGGDPFWVGLLGQAYIRGLHTGSDNRMAVVAKHFPGYGNADRNPDEEVPTISKSLEQLKQIELYPFFSVTGNAADPSAAADALLSAHIRFRGFQGDLRQSTNPVSFDPQAFGQLLALPEIKTWRDQGGVTVSDSLGVAALKKFPAYIPFNNKRIAREAFNAGNDLLFLSEFGLNPRSDQTATIIDTLTFFAQQYEANPDFAQHVDAAVERLLTLKLRVFGGQFSAERAQVSADGLSALGQSTEQLSVLAQNAATLVFPSLNELSAPAPASAERLVFFTDVRLGARPCSFCAAAPELDKHELERAILQRYGPQGSEQIRPGNLQSFSLDELDQYLNAPSPPATEAGTPTPEPSAMEQALAQADWYVFSLLSLTPAVPASGVLTRFLAQHSDIVRDQNKRIIVFAFDAPYYLDATDLSKLDAFYALYSPGPSFVDAAARLLFRDLAPTGRPPVSVQSVGYNLIEATSPDPQQVIALTADKQQGNVGDTLQLHTGILLDHNQHFVPDGTRVRFLAKYQGDELPTLLENVLTHSGVATTTLTLNRIGLVEISADSDPAFQSFKLQINVQENTPAFITVIAPTPIPSDTPTPPTPTPTPSPTSPPITETPVATPTQVAPEVNRVQDRDFFMLCLGLIAALAVGYQLGALGGTGEATPTRRMRVALAGVIGVLAGYNYFAVGLPGADWALGLGLWAPTAWVILGAVGGLSAGWYWFVRRS